MKKMIKKMSLVFIFLLSSSNLHATPGISAAAEVIVNQIESTISTVSSAIPGVNTAKETISEGWNKIKGAVDMDISGASSESKVRPIQVWKTVEWAIFFDTFEINGWGTCPDYPIPDFGIDVRIAEVAAFAETTSYKWSIPTVGGKVFDNTSDILKNGASRTNKDEGDSNDGGRGDLSWAHYIKFPLMGYVLGSSSLFCFDNFLPFVYFGEFDPTFTEDWMNIYLHPVQTVQKILFNNLIGLISTIADCVASEFVNMATISSDPMNGQLKKFVAPMARAQIFDGISSGISKVLGGAKYFLNGVRDMMIYSQGCQSFATLGGYGEGKDPTSDHELVVASMMDQIVTLKNLGIGFTSQTWKQTEMMYVPVTTMCWPLPAPHYLKSQYILQRAGWPSIGKGHVGGVSDIHAANANSVGAQDEWVSFVWKIRDYRAFAYKCL